MGGADSECPPELQVQQGVRPHSRDYLSPIWSGLCLSLPSWRVCQPQEGSRSMTHIPDRCFVVSTALQPLIWEESILKRPTEHPNGRKLFPFLPTLTSIHPCTPVCFFLFESPRRSGSCSPKVLRFIKHANNQVVPGPHLGREWGLASSPQCAWTPQPGPWKKAAGLNSDSQF